jgi:hypothetical protein
MTRILSTGNGERGGARSRRTRRSRLQFDKAVNAHTIIPRGENCRTTGTYFLFLVETGTKGAVA